MSRVESVHSSESRPTNRTLRHFHREAKGALLRGAASLPRGNERNYSRSQNFFTLSDKTGVKISSDSWSHLPRQYNTTCEIIDPTPVYADGRTTYKAHGIAINTGLGLMKRTSAVYEKDMLGQYVPLPDSKKYEEPLSDNPITDRELQELIVKMKQVDGKTLSLFGVSIDTEDLATANIISEKVQSLFTHPIPDFVRPSLDDLIIHEDQTLGRLAQLRSRANPHSNQLERSQESLGSYEYVSRRYVTAEGEAVTISVRDNFKTVVVDIGLPNDPDNCVSYHFTPQRAFSVTETKQGDSAADFGMGVIVEDTKTHAHDVLTEDDRQHVYNVVEGIREDIVFGNQVKEQIKKVLVSAELRDPSVRTRDAISGDLIKTELTFPTGDRVILTAREDKNKEFPEVSIERWEDTDSDRPDQIRSHMIYLDLTQTSPLIAGRDMIHHIEVGNADIRHDAAWGDVGLSNRAKIDLYKNPSSRKGYRVTQAQREQVRSMLALVA